MHEQRMIKPCMQRFNEALKYEHVNVREYNPHACMHATVTRTHGCKNARDALLHACPSTRRNTHGHAQVLNLHVHAHTYSVRVS